MLRLSLEVYNYVSESKRRRGQEPLPPLRRWVFNLPGLEGRPHASLSRFLEEEDH